MRVKRGYSFDDVLLVPQFSKVESRSEVDLSVDFGKGVKLEIPVISANMKNVTELEMVRAIRDLGGLPILHRFMPEDFRVFMVNKVKSETDNVVGHSVGVGESEKKLAYRLIINGCKIICVDVAHGDHELSLRMVEYISSEFPEVLLIAGNVATGMGARRLASAGADVVKCGIGGGCFAAGTRVLMSNGTYKNIEEVKVGDRIINKNGDPKTVKAAFCTGVKKVLKVKNSLFYKPTFVTPDHKYWVLDLNNVKNTTLSNHGYGEVLGQESKTTPKRSKIKWKEVGDFKEDCLLLPRSISFEMDEDFTINLHQDFSGNSLDNLFYKKDIELKPNYDLGFIFGAFLGNGHAMEAEYNDSNIGSVNWYFNKPEMDLAEKLSKCINSCFDKNISIREENSIIKCTLNYKSFANFLSQFGNLDQKHLPPKFLVKNLDYLKGILDGLIASDVHVEENSGVRFSNTSPEVIELFGVVSYLVTGLFSNNEKGRCPTKEVVFLELPVYDLTIDCETHSFIADNAIVHNSLCTTRIETGCGVPQLTALEDVYKSSRSDYSDVRDYKIIADGGIKNSGDIVKSLCFSDGVMLGSLLSGSDETPGEIIELDGVRMKSYEGSSTHKTNHIEGVKAMVPLKGPVKPIVEKLMEGVRSGCSYQGVDNLLDLKESPEFVEISNAGLVESHPHIMRR